VLKGKLKEKKILVSMGLYYKEKYSKKGPNVMLNKILNYGKLSAAYICALSTLYITHCIIIAKLYLPHRSCRDAIIGAAKLASVGGVLEMKRESVLRGTPKTKLWLFL
jgi:hypothetical protein